MAVRECDGLSVRFSLVKIEPESAYNDPSLRSLIEDMAGTRFQRDLEAAGVPHDQQRVLHWGKWEHDSDFGWWRYLITQTVKNKPLHDQHCKRCVSVGRAAATSGQ